MLGAVVDDFANAFLEIERIENEMVRSGIDLTKCRTESRTSRLYLHCSTIGSMTINPCTATRNQRNAKLLGSHCFSDVTNQIPVERETQFRPGKMIAQFVPGGDQSDDGWRKREPFQRQPVHSPFFATATIAGRSRRSLIV